MPVKHIVMFTLQSDVPEEKVAALKNGLLGLPKQLGVFSDYELGMDLKLEAGQKHPSGKNRSIVWSASFATIEDYEMYDSSKEHAAVIANLIKPIIVPGSRAAIQYEF